MNVLMRAGLAAVLGAWWAPAQTVLFRLPLSTDTAVHYYYDHDTTSGIRDWKCGTETYNGHRGTDFSGGPRGRPIYAGAVGTLGYKIDGFGDGWIGNTDGGGFGNYVRLDHTGNFRSYYAHMNAGTVTTKSVGSSIACGEQIGGVGTSGNSSGLHLHFEVRYNNVADDPYAGPCGGPVSWWVNQGSGSPSTNCQGAVLIPPAPSGLTATPMSASQINLNWTDNATNESGFRIERAPLPGGPWTVIGTVASNVTVFSNTGLANSSTYFFRVRAYNTAGDSPYSNIASATTSNAAPVLAAIGNQTVNEGDTLSFTCSASDTSLGVTTVLTDFENFASGAANGSVLFRHPTFSGTTSGYLEASPNVSSVTDTFPTGLPGTRVLNVNWSFTSNAVNPWLRLTTFNPSNLPNPTVSFEQRLRFDIRSDKSLNVALGLRETGTAAALGADGGTTGPIEFVGVSGKNGNTPLPTRTIPANTWTNLDFDLPNEPLAGLTGNGVLESVTGKGVLEHLALVPNAGNGAYNIYLDNFVHTLPHRLTYSLEAGAPAGATIHPQSGQFSWTPTEAQGPGVYSLTVRVTDNGSPPLSHTRTFTVTVNEVNQPPVLAPIPDRTVNAGATLVFTNAATDPDLPPNALTFSLDAAPPGATIGPTNGVFSWTAPPTEVPLTNAVTVRVSDNGTPLLSDTKSFQIIVVPPPRFAEAQLLDTGVVFGWQVFPGRTYRVQFKNDLNEPVWNELGGDLLAVDSILWQTNRPVTNAQQFFRLVAP